MRHRQRRSIKRKPNKKDIITNGETEDALVNDAREEEVEKMTVSLQLLNENEQNKNNSKILFCNGTDGGFCSKVLQPVEAFYSSKVAILDNTLSSIICPPDDMKLVLFECSPGDRCDCNKTLEVYEQCFELTTVSKESLPTHIPFPTDRKEEEQKTKDAVIVVLVLSIISLLGATAGMYVYKERRRRRFQVQKEHGNNVTPSNGKCTYTDENHEQGAKNNTHELQCQQSCDSGVVCNVEINHDE
ncbi:unnamed protein product [Mytilus edulis]|uniref:Uncharacterized protein n=1 Tax=Mytilus edulis TaxID=6550 RepID=A0A8S3U406_MYTED|nr:unnamed protein product [Mytilus edulis]